jgi:tyrosinase
MTRTRMDVWSLTRAEGDWPQALVAYEQAVGLLRQRDPASGPPVDPIGWRFLAAMHGLESANGGPDTSNALWSNCQHGSWFFLPWHRMYLYALELIVQHVLEDEEWSLPYWYSVDPDDADKSVLPPAFRDTSNNLHTDNRSSLINAGVPLPVQLAPSIADALVADIYSTPEGTSTFGGGERAEPSFSGEEVGLLEDTPHGAVHVLVGNDFDAQGNLLREGWMGSFYTAALDPVFWLHHANIDRLWQVWLDHDPAHRNPTDDPAWFDTTFSFPSAEGGLHTWSIGEVLDTEALGYKYENTAAPSIVGPPVGPEEVSVPERRPPQLIGATQDVSLATTDAVEIPLEQPVEVGPGEAAAGAGGRVFLRIEGVTGTAAAPVYDVYLNVPSGDAPSDHPELRAGSLSTFGMAEASESDDLHDGSGRTHVFDVTRVRAVLEEQGRWDAGRLQVVFSPVALGSGADAVEGGTARTPDIRASRVGVVLA